MKTQSPLFILACLVTTAGCGSDNRPPTAPPPIITSSDLSPSSMRAPGDPSTTNHAIDPSAGRPESESMNAASPGASPTATTMSAAPGANEPVATAPRSALDQGNNEVDTKITAAIRRDVVASKALSLMAKNVQIVTAGSVVTLRGPIKNENERATLVALAWRTQGVTIVNDQLEVR